MHASHLKKLHQAEVADGRAETADSFDRAEYFRTKQHQLKYTIIAQL